MSPPPAQSSGDPATPAAAPDEQRSSRPRTARAVVDWFIRDPRSGEVVIAQRPNLPILLWAATLAARLVVGPGTTASEVLAWAGSITLGWWAVDEVVRGVNPFRRSLGLVGCAVVIVGVIGRL